MGKMSRRDMIKGLGAMGALAIAGPLAGLAGCSTSGSSGNTGTNGNSNTGTTNTGSTGSSNLSPDCVLTPSQVEGPFYVKASEVRSDITDGKTGAPLRLVLTVLNARTCAAIPNALVDLWHADAIGLYSAYTAQGDGRNVDTTGQDFLRGIQVTGSDGKASFTSIYPGWYPGRTTHMHFKIHFNDSTMVTSQLYFPEATSTEVYTSHAAYKSRGDKDTPNTRDMVRNQATGPEHLDLTVQKQGDVYVAAIKIGIAIG